MYVEKAYEVAIAENFIRCFVDENGESGWVDYHNSYKYEQSGALTGFELSSDFLLLSNNDICGIIDDSLNQGML